MLLKSLIYISLIATLAFPINGYTKVKGKGYFTAQVERVSENNAPDLFRLKGTITSKVDFSSIKVSWILPEDVEVVSGSLELTNKIARGETQSYEILLKTAATTNRQIHFVVQETVDIDGENFGATAQYNTKLFAEDNSSQQEQQLTTRSADHSAKPQAGQQPARKKLKKPKKIIQ